ncbi:MAG: serine/threonine-protein kinase [Calothrix sp. MO_167.B12]|nr:serine/threonine-protein kinase [Calothrix sp. MO_167.B12]
MICCLNPDCPNPLNPDGKKFCQTCSTPLVPLLRNRFRVVRVLSDEGGFGRTYLAEDIDKLDEHCVIKQLAPKFQGTWAISKAMELFQKEAQRLKQLGEHSQIPTLLAYFEQDNYMFLVQQFIDGHNLLKELQWKVSYNSKDIKEILLSLLPVLKFIHDRGVIHRDIKPQNIIRRQSDKRLCLIDFGSSKQLTARVQMKMGTSIGSHGYSPLEQIRDGAAYPASDLFSLGATCFHLLTGTSPFQLWMEHGYSWVKNWRQYLRTKVDRDLAQVLDGLLQKDIKQRYQSADEVLMDLTANLEPLPSLVMEEVVATPPKPLPTQLPIARSKYIKLINIFTIVFGITLLGFGEFWYRQYRHLESNISSSINNPNHHSVKNPSLLPVVSPISWENFSLVKTLGNESQAIVSFAFSPDGSTIATARDRRITLWNIKTGQEISTLNGHSQPVTTLAISPDGQTLVSGSRDKTIKLWNLATGQEIRTLGVHSHAIKTLAFSADGQILADGSADKTIKLWNLLTRKEILTLKGHSGIITSLAIAPNKQILASGSSDKTIKLWHLASSRQIRTLKGHLGTVTSLAIAPSGKLLASSSNDNTIKLWNLESGQQIITLRGHLNRVNTLAIAPSGKVLASGSNDNTIKLWNLESGQQITTLRGHQQGIKAIAFSKDGKTLISGSKDGMKIWQATH